MLPRSLASRLVTEKWVGFWGHVPLADLGGESSKGLIVTTCEVGCESGENPHFGGTNNLYSEIFLIFFHCLHT